MQVLSLASNGLIAPAQTYALCRMIYAINKCLPETGGWLCLHWYLRLIADILPVIVILIIFRRAHRLHHLLFIYGFLMQ